MKTHTLKIEERYIQAIVDGRKTFEIRLNDRDYQVGDIVQFKCNSQDPGIYCFYSGRIERMYKAGIEKYGAKIIQYKIGYISAYEQKAGYVVFSLLAVNK